jgi:4,5:9,10-diseco-3-hydroxy-5,9,17-trioxoandrosta-1(10),2-diene-4-oate hydrolase
MSGKPGRLVNVDGLDTFIDVTGSGPPVLLVHGSGPANYGHFAWRTVAPALAEHLTVIVVDVPGYGDSAPLTVADTPVNAARHLLKVMRQLGHERFAVAGHSRGGRIACELAAEAGGAVTRLVISGSGSAVPGGHRSDSGGFTDAALALVNFGADGNTSFEEFCRVRRTSVYDDAHLPDELLRETYDWFIGSGMIDVYVKHMAEVDPLNFYHASDLEDFRARLRRLDLPTLIVWGREDEISDYRRLPALIDELPRPELRLFPYAGHSLMFDQPDRLNPVLIEFLTRED